MIHSPVLKNELSTYVEYPDGSMGAAEGCFDDTVMATAMVFFVVVRGAMTLADKPLTPEEYNVAADFTFESIIKEMTLGRTGATFPSYITGIES